ncbi:MAG: phosphoglucomutase/phosphomannomutase family protein [Eubacteriales bacterium]|nr:phosphoglucomutase/phosphomannomutase family protein [Eubacteriales bacterium]
MIKFGTGGFRAVIGDEFTRRNIQILAKALSMKMMDEACQDQGICIGYDRRFLSKEAVMWACEVFGAMGIRCWFVNRSSPTPLIMYYVMANDLPYGLMVTASHNPAIYNGVKLFTRGGRDASQEVTQDLERYIQQVELELKMGGEVSWRPYEQVRDAGLVVEFNPWNDYIDSILSQIDTRAIRSAGLRVALDPMYGVSQTSLKTILSVARCEVETIHERHDTLFGGKLPAPNAATLRTLQNYVLDRGCHIGIATDGDADRIGIIDDRGRFLHPNDILVLLYHYLLCHKGWKGPAVRNISTTHRLDKVAQSFGQVCYEVPVGFKYISSKMQETDALIGGESSGGLTVRGHIHGKDGIYAAALLVEMMAVTGKRLSQLEEEMEERYGRTWTEERDYPMTDGKKEEIHRLLFQDRLIPQLPFRIQKVSYLDGCKIYLEDGGWVIARFSGTEPLLRIFCEAKDQERARQLCEIFEAFMEGDGACQLDKKPDGM